MAAKPLVYFGTSYYSTYSSVVQKYDSAGNDFGQISLGAGSNVNIFDIAGDASGYVYFVGSPDQNTGYSLWKYHRDGQLIWAAAHGATLYGVAVDSSGNVYACGQPGNGTEAFFSGSRTGFYTLRKYDSDGNLLWSVDGEPNGLDPANYNYDIQVLIDSSGHPIVASIASASYDTLGGIRKHSSSDGSLTWRWNNSSSYGWSNRAIAVDSSGNVYGGDEIGGAGYIVKLNSSGVQQWFTTLESGQRVNDIVWFSNKIIALAKWYPWLSWPGCLVRLDDATGTKETGWPTTNIAYNDFNKLDVDADGDLYFSGTYAAYKYDDSAAQIWIKYIPDVPLISCVCVVETETPALKIPLGFGIPTLIGDLYTAVPGLSFGIAPATPRDILEFSGAIQPGKIYRVYLTGGAGTIELPASYLSCRRDVSNTALTITCPAMTSEQVDAVLERTDGMLVVKSGLRFSDGSEQFVEMARASFSSIRWDSGARSSSVTLNGLSTELTASPQSRALRGISYYNMSNGLRRVRCAIDSYLNPGDTADLGGGETLVVREITISISPTSAVMEIAEAL